MGGKKYIRTKKNKCKKNIKKTRKVGCGKKSINLLKTKKKKKSIKYGGNLRKPTSIKICKNLNFETQEPFPPDTNLDDLRILPSNNCVTKSQLINMEHWRDPYTNEDLPEQDEEEFREERNRIREERRLRRQQANESSSDSSDSDEEGNDFIRSFTVQREEQNRRHTALINSVTDDLRRRIFSESSESSGLSD